MLQLQNLLIQYYLFNLSYSYLFSSTTWESFTLNEHKKVIALACYPDQINRKNKFDFTDGCRYLFGIVMKIAAKMGLQTTS